MVSHKGKAAVTGVTRGCVPREVYSNETVMTAVAGWGADRTSGCPPRGFTDATLPPAEISVCSFTIPLRLILRATAGSVGFTYLQTWRELNSTCADSPDWAREAAKTKTASAASSLRAKTYGTVWRATARAKLPTYLSDGNALLLPRAIKYLPDDRPEKDLRQLKRASAFVSLRLAVSQIDIRIRFLGAAWRHQTRSI